MDLFDVIPDNFFQLLTGKNKHLYLACLFKSFNIYEQGSILGIDKKVVADELTHFLETSDFLFTKETEEDEVDEDEEDASESKRALAYFVLRRFEQTGWIYVDVTSDYEEILNFTDNGISMVEALQKMSPWQGREYLQEDDISQFDWLQTNSNEYNGYIYTIYSLLMNPTISDYGILINEVYRNTKLLIRALRKLDSRLKDYISSVVENAEIKSLIEKLMDYKVELVDNGYARLKTGDNINKYRLPIVSKLEDLENDEQIMYQITDNYKSRFLKLEDAYKRAYRDIDEMIDVFNALDEYITEIDNKNSKYIDSTIGKIKFLLSEDDNIIGKLNDILKFIKLENKRGHVDKAIKEVAPLFTLRETKGMAEGSLFTPRGKYSTQEGELLDLSRFDLGDETEAFFSTYTNQFNEENIKEFLYNHLENHVFEAARVIDYDTDVDTVIMVIYCLIYAGENDFEFERLDDYIYHNKFKMRNFRLKEVK